LRKVAPSVLIPDAVIPSAGKNFPSLGKFTKRNIFISFNSLSHHDRGETIN
jgi:hypothetical protein